MTVLNLLLPFILLLLGAGISSLFASRVIKRVPFDKVIWAFVVFPLASFLWLARLVGPINAGEKLTISLSWVPSLNLNFAIYLDGLALLFALIITGIGTLIVLYTGYYFKGDASSSRFVAYILLFMTAMLGVVMAGDVISLFVLWEITSVTSFLLVAYKSKDPAARNGAFRALFITGAGGVILLLGLVGMSTITGTTELPAILKQGDLLRSHSLYPLLLTFVAIGAFTKSAQFPFHFWLPGAMQAPTPASAYLHSATMVKAGIYLLARMNPALGQTELWFWTLTLAGMVTMVLGAYLGLKQNDLKALLAYSTISQLGALVMLIGQDTDIAFKALIVGVVAHALYKSALFMVAGIIDHETHTRDIRMLGGLRRNMPVVFSIASIAALSMAGLPPLFGFLAKETLLATAVHPSVPSLLAWIFPLAVVVAGAFLLAQSGFLIAGTFFGKLNDKTRPAHDPYLGMSIAAGIPAVLSLALGILPEPAVLATLIAKAAAASFGDSVKVSLALWTGLNIPLLLSAIAITVGSIIFYFRDAVRNFQTALLPNAQIPRAFDGFINGIDWAALTSTRLQLGRLRFYLLGMLTAVIGLVFLFGGLVLPADITLTWPSFSFDGEIVLLREFSLFVLVAASMTTIFLVRDFAAIVALGASGLAAAVLMVLEPAPDVALVQVVVDILAVVILVLALTRLPREQRRRAYKLNHASKRLSVLRDAIVSLGIGTIVGWITFTALVTRPRESAITPFYEETAKTLTGAKDIVGAIIVDYRALDTLIEISVFSLAGIGIYTLLRFAARKFGDEMSVNNDTLVEANSQLRTLGIGGTQTSPFLHFLGVASFPLAMVIAATHMMYGHDQPGDGFTAGVILSLAVGFQFIVFGFYDTRRRLSWLKSAPLIISGIGLAIVNGLVAYGFTGSFLGNVNYGGLVGLPLPTGFALSSSFLLEVAICLAVLGSVTYMINTLGHPGFRDPESQKLLKLEAMQADDLANGQTNSKG